MRSLRWPRPVRVKARRARYGAARWAGCRGRGPDSTSDYACGITSRKIRDCGGLCWRATVSFAGARLRAPVMRTRFNWSATLRARRPAFGGPRIRSLPQAERLRLAAEIMPKLRGLMSNERAKIGHLSADPETL